MRFGLSATVAAAVLYGAVILFGLGPASPSALGRNDDRHASVVRVSHGPAVPGPVQRGPQPSTGPARHRMQQRREVQSWERARSAQGDVKPPPKPPPADPRAPGSVPAATPSPSPLPSQPPPLQPSAVLDTTLPEVTAPSPLPEVPEVEVPTLPLPPLPSSELPSTPSLPLP